MALITSAIALKALKKGFKTVTKKSKAALTWAAENWIPLLLVAVLVASSAFWYKRGVYSGSASCDETWMKKYNDVVADFNKRLEEAKKNSSAVADNVDGANAKVNEGLDDLQGALVNTAKRQDKDAKASAGVSVNGTLPTCVQRKVNLNDPLPQEFFDTWSKMNEVGATHDPYADVK